MLSHLVNHEDRYKALGFPVYEISQRLMVTDSLGCGVDQWFMADSFFPNVLANAIERPFVIVWEGQTEETWLPLRQSLLQPIIIHWKPALGATSRHFLACLLKGDLPGSPSERGRTLPLAMMLNCTTSMMFPRRLPSAISLISIGTEMPIWLCEDMLLAIACRTRRTSQYRRGSHIWDPM